MSSSTIPQIPALPTTNPSQAVFDSIRISIARRLSDTLPLTLEQAFAGVDYGKKGEDFTVALPRFRLPGPVSEVASKVIEGFQSDEWIESIVTDNSFLHFRVNTTNMICLVLNQVNAFSHSGPGQPEYGANDSGKGKKVIIEFSSPNIVKEFHIGHLRSTIIGAFLVNLYKLCGWEVIAMNYLGDWGTQFGMVAIGYEKYGSQVEFDKDPLMHLYDVYVKITADAEAAEAAAAATKADAAAKADATGDADSTHANATADADTPNIRAEARAWFKRMEDGDEDALKKWRVWRDISLTKYQEAYAQLNIHFDVYTGESSVGKESMDTALSQLQDMGLISDRDGAMEIDLSAWDLNPPIVLKKDGTYPHGLNLRKKDGSSTYLTRDIGAAMERYERYNFDKMIYVVGAAQDLHVKKIFKILELMGLPWAKNLIHINFGKIDKMSTRKGTAVFLEHIIKQAGDVMHDQMKKNEDKYAAVEDPETTSSEIAITGIKIQDMAAKRINDYPFNWDRMLSFEGDTGPYLQYAHARLASIGRKNPHLLPLPPASQIATYTLAQYSHARDIAFLLGTYPDVVKVALKTHEPSGVVTFAFKLAHAISSAWDSVVVKGEEDLEKARAKMYLYECAREVLAAAMRLLSIRPLERM